MQAENVEPSNEHWNVAPLSELNANVGEGSAVGSAGPEAIVVSGAIVSTVKPTVTGMTSMFPARSAAETLNECDPSPSELVEYGDAQAAKAAKSNAQANDAPCSELNENVAEAVFVNPDGPPVIEVCGGTVSIVNVRAAGDGSTFPIVSIAFTKNVCSPWSRDATKVPLLQGVAGSEKSNEHLNVEPASDEEKLKFGDSLFVNPVGPAVIDVSGGVASTVKSRWAGEASALPAASVAFTRKVWPPSGTVAA